MTLREKAEELADSTYTAQAGQEPGNAVSPIVPTLVIAAVALAALAAFIIAN